MRVRLVYFFFQAEDGIRDGHVTGVQTCALPIYILVEAFAAVREAAERTLGQRPYDVQIMGGTALHRGRIAEMKTGRSEERRVGKEGRSSGASWHSETKQKNTKQTPSPINTKSMN